MIGFFPVPPPPSSHPGEKGTTFDKILQKLTKNVTVTHSAKHARKFHDNLSIQMAVIPMPWMCIRLERGGGSVFFMAMPPSPPPPPPLWFGFYLTVPKSSFSSSSLH